MADAWTEEDWKLALEPLGRALDALADDIEIFEAIVARAAAEEG